MIIFDICPCGISCTLWNLVDYVLFNLVLRVLAKIIAAQSPN